MIGNVTIDNLMTIPDEFYNSIKQPKLQSLVNVKTGAYVLTYLSTGLIRTNYHFTEMRIVCTKPWHGRRVDVVLTGQIVDDLLDQQSNLQRALLPGEYRPLPRDTSLLFNTSPNEILRKKSSAHLYYFPIFVFAKAHVSIRYANRIECDDYHSDTGFQTAGNWQFYIR